MLIVITYDYPSRIKELQWELRKWIHPFRHPQSLQEFLIWNNLTPDLFSSCVIKTYDSTN